MEYNSAIDHHLCLLIHTIYWQHRLLFHYGLHKSKDLIHKVLFHEWKTLRYQRYFNMQSTVEKYNTTRRYNQVLFRGTKVTKIIKIHISFIKLCALMLYELQVMKTYPF